MDGWYYSQSGQSVGPVSLADLKQMIAAGQVSGEDQVWHPSLASWTAARKVPGLATPRQSPAVQSPQAVDPYAGQQQPYAPADQYQPQGVLGYQGAGTGDVVATARALTFLQQTRPWVMFIAVLFFLSAGLLALAGIMMLVGGSFMFNAGGRRSAAPVGLFAGVAIVYFVFGFIYFLLGFYLAKYFSSIGSLMYRRQSVDLEAALKAQLQFWRITGISIIAGIILYLIFMVFIFTSLR